MTMTWWWRWRRHFLRQFFFYSLLFICFSRCSSLPANKNDFHSRVCVLCTFLLYGRLTGSPPAAQPINTDTQHSPSTLIVLDEVLDFFGRVYCTRRADFIADVNWQICTITSFLGWCYWRKRTDDNNNKNICAKLWIFTHRRSLYIFSQCQHTIFQLTENRRIIKRRKK